MHSATKKIQQGSALLVLVALILAAMSYVIVKALNSGTEAGRNEANAAVLSQAKQALIGFAATYRDDPFHTCVLSSDTCPFGYLPCPDIDNNGTADACGAQNISAIGRLPWKTLGLPPLRDSSGECLWYAVSGRAKDNFKTTVFNWDTLGQFQIDNADGTTLVAASSHNTPWAVIFSPGAALAAQDRTPAVASECGGNNNVANYLDGADTIYTAALLTPNADSILTLSTANSIRDGSNNDQAQWIISNDIFDVVKPRSDFVSDINTMLDDMQTCLETNFSLATLPSTSVGNKGIDNIIVGCPVVDVKKQNVLSNWRNNLLYTKPAASVVANGTNCNAVLFFGGERATGQTRATVAEIGDAATFGTPSRYLEAPNAALFPTGSGYVGVANFTAATSADLVRCIKIGSSHISFASDFASFTTAGAGITKDTATKTATIAPAAGTSGGCLWLPNPVTVAGKTVRAFFDYQFFTADTYALSGIGTDRGNGITLMLVDGSMGAPATCGHESNMGALSVAGGPGGMWAPLSFAIETDVHRDINPPDTLTNPNHIDPIENHTAIMAFGNLEHGIVPGANGYLTTACDGTAAGCRFNTSVNKFEESPSTLSHNQRVEIFSGCDSACTTCDPATHSALNSFIKIKVWVDCASCDDVTTNSAAIPTVARCLDLDPDMNSTYIALTGGFRSSPPTATQSVTLSNFILRSE